MSDQLELELIKLLTRRGSLKAFFKKLPIDTSRAIQFSVDEAMTELEREYAKALEKEKERLQKIESYKKMLIEDGINPEDLATLADQGRPKDGRSKATPKYAYIDINGNSRTWTGQGRQPLPIRDAIAAGKNLEDFIIR